MSGPSFSDSAPRFHGGPPNPGAGVWDPGVWGPPCPLGAGTGSAEVGHTPDVLTDVTAAFASVRRQVWSRSSVTNRTDPVVLDIDASLVEIHSENKEHTAPTFKGGFGFHPMFDTPQYSFHQPASLLAYLILAVIVSLGALLFVKTLYGMRRITFVRLQRWPNHIKPAIGGLLVGIIGFFLPEALGTGYGTVQMCFNSDAGREPALMALPTAQAVVALLGWRISPVALGAGLLAAIGLGKILTTSLTVGSGGSGGAFGPAVVIGAALGGATGLVCMHLFPYLDIQPGAFALVGMAGFFAGAAHTPVSTIIMVSEITGNYDLLVPSMLVCITSFVLCRRFTLYEKQLLSRLEAPTKLGNMASAILRRLTVREALATRRDTPVLVARSTSLSELMKRFAQSTHAAFPVVDEKQQLVGVVDAGDIRRVVTEAGVGDLIIAGDIEKTAVTITPDDSLLSAINSMVQAGSLDLVVVESPGSRQVVGTLNRADIFTAYNRAMIEQTVPIL